VSTKSSEGYSTDEDLIELGRVVDNCKKKIKKLKQKVKEQKKEMRSIVCNNVKLEEKLKRMEQALDDVTEQKKQLQEELVSKEMLNDQLQEGIRLAQEKSISKINSCIVSDNGQLSTMLRRSDFRKNAQNLKRK